MSKRQELRDRRHREHIRNRIIVILLFVVGAVLVTFALVLPLVNSSRAAANAAATPVIQVTPQTFTAKVDGVHLGDPNAPVKVDIYGDFRCSACAYYFQNVEPQIIKNYVDTGKAYYTFHSYIVIDGHDGSDASYRSANAAMCAAAQNRFWDYHDTLYANQVTEDASLYTDVRLVKMAENIKLDMNAFNACYQAKQYASQVQQDITQAQGLNVSGTPTLFVNGKVVQDFQQTAQAIDAALAGK